MTDEAEAGAGKKGIPPWARNVGVVGGALTGFSSIAIAASQGAWMAVVVHGIGVLLILLLGAWADGFRAKLPIPGGLIFVVALAMLLGGDGFLPAATPQSPTVTAPVVVASTPTGEPANMISKKQFSDAWPLTVEAGAVGCDDGDKAWFQPDGQTKRYAVNGTAAKLYPPLDPILAPDTEAMAESERVAGEKLPFVLYKDKSALLKAALATCG